MATLGKYTLVRKIATGGMAEVFLARADGPMGFEKKLVVKRILPHLAGDPNFVAMFLSEAKLAAQLNHPNTVQIFDFGEADGQYFIAMEYIDGPNLRVLNRVVREAEGPLPLVMAARLLTMACEGLNFAHELKDASGQPVNLVHRDISPDNILLSRQGSVKVVDFGIAKAAAGNAVNLTRSGVIKGKMAYMPPEQLNREQLDRRADIYALGVVLYELVAGAMPFDATSEVSIIQAIMTPKPFDRVTQHRPETPGALEAIINKALQKDRTLRYSTCRELQTDLERFIASTGEVVSSADLGQVVERHFPPEWEPTLPSAHDAEADGLDRTMQSNANKVARVASAVGPVPEAALPSGFSKTQLGAVKSKGRTGLIAGGVVALLAVSAVAAWFLRPVPVEPKALPPPPLAVIDAGPPKVVEPLPPVDAGAAVAVESVDAGAAEPADAGALAAAKTGKVEFRIRPYASVSVDGKPMGDTPMPPLTLPLGKHKITLKNAELAKEVNLTVVVKPGTNVVKHNFKE